jgi:hypothetical protein
MKKLLAIIILSLCFITPSQAEDIRNFQIEEISIGDSLLSHFSKEEIEKKQKIFFPKSNKFFRISFRRDGNTYDFIGVYLKKNDFNYKVHSLEGSKYMDYLTCKNKKKKVESELNSIFKNKYNIVNDEKAHAFDETKKSMVDISEFYGKNNYLAARIICTDWSKKMEEQEYFDVLSIYILSKEYSAFLINEAYK